MDRVFIFDQTISIARLILAFREAVLRVLHSLTKNLIYYTIHKPRTLAELQIELNRGCQ